ncbi:MAG: sensor histidine kinase, partial [Candidatus Paceibacterota bacterium]
MKVLRNRGFRWILLMLGLVAIIALTGMNVLSLYSLRDSMVEEEVDRRIDQLDDINDSIRNQILEPLRGLHQLELEPIESTLQTTGQLPSNIQEILDRASKSPFFNGIYFTQEGVDPCDEDASIYLYSPLERQVLSTNDYPDLVCDGAGLGKTKTRIRLNDFDYRWNNHLQFDSHRSLNLGLINLNENRLIGVITIVLNANYIIEEAISPVLSNSFGDSKQSG